MVTLSGITWDHPRGRAPLVVTAEEFARDHGVPIKLHDGRRGASCKAQHELPKTSMSSPKKGPLDDLGTALPGRCRVTRQGTSWAVAGRRSL
jgi:hypothetical protein